MNNYYLTLVLREVEEKERKALLDAVEKKVRGGKVKRDDWGARDLAYPIKKQNKGFYAHFEFEADPKLIKGLDKGLRVEENVLRYLLVRI